jgi:hypothetical protein
MDMFATCNEGNFQYLVRANALLLSRLTAAARLTTNKLIVKILKLMSWWKGPKRDNYQQIEHAFVCFLSEKASQFTSGMMKNCTMFTGWNTDFLEQSIDTIVYSF